MLKIVHENRDVMFNFILVSVQLDEPFEFIPANQVSWNHSYPLL